MNYILQTNTDKLSSISYHFFSATVRCGARAAARRTARRRWPPRPPRPPSPTGTARPPPATAATGISEGEQRVTVGKWAGISYMK